ncbi:MAG TPA: hypothetical protein DDX39_11025 [Bacteroidales bacterium]|nr:MAG: hypothetical protein A2W98_12035 [Bacteroidetes bacterium GWF2_33_38]OFY74160.1 MAG: hypothetical protein A2265_03995 [Bacteroidetes bacterium RIFOXYA12_FULL_33_9]OFY91104.1 MAG: hypothetical protein A2236_12765 [Bacteroidetes bacterium RIFOXYA2_FULL_33_7]HBF89163.1 hypothetical protein [Bacteroidales bacterium]
MYYESTGETGSQYSEITGERGTSIIDTIYKRMCNVDLSNVSSIYKIHVNVGTGYDLSDLFDYAFIVNDSLNLPDGMTYTSYGSQIYLGLYNIYKTDMNYYKVWLEDADGELSEPKYFY